MFRNSYILAGKKTIIADKVLLEKINVKN